MGLFVSPIANDASAFVAVLFREYCARRKAGKSIEESAHMGDDVVIQRDLVPKMLIEDVTHICWYLEEKGILYAEPGDDMANQVAITDDGIVYMENRFPQGVKDALDLIGSLRSIVPWLP